MKLTFQLFLCAALSCLGHAQSTERVSVDSTGAQGDNWSADGYATPDGRFVLFTSEAANFGAVPNLHFAFVRDRTSATTTLVSVSPAGALPDLAANGLGISADGRYVLFSTAATNLGADGPGTDLFVRDRQSGVTQLATADSSGVPANSGTGQGVLSADGRFVAFSTTASNLVVGDTNATYDVFVRDLVLGQTTRVSVDSAGTQANSSSQRPAISADGRFVAFTSSATNLVAGDTNGKQDIFVHDRQTAQTSRVSVSTTGAQATGDSFACWISGDGQRVSIYTFATLVPEDTNSDADIYVRDRLTATTVRASVSSSGLQLTQGVNGGMISADGNYVTFSTPYGALVPNDTNDAWDAFVHDLSTGRTTRESVSSTGVQGDANVSTSEVIVANANFVVFTSSASNLVANDTNGKSDVFFRERGPGQITPFCAGDASVLACPCGNSGTNRRGCASSYTPFSANGARGAYLGGYGSAVVSADTLLLQAEQVTGSTTLFYQADAQQSPSILDDGISCVGGSILRLATKTNVAHAALYPQPGDPSIAVKGLVPAGGGTRYYQAWYRDELSSFCPPATTNRTNGLIVVWGP
jgi:hypothetical protein